MGTSELDSEKISDSDWKKIKKLMYYQNKYEPIETNEKMLECLKELAEDQGSFECQCAQAWSDFHKKNYEAAFRQCAALMSREDVQPLLNLYPMPSVPYYMGIMYIKGWGTEKNEKEGLLLLSRALLSAQRFYAYYQDHDKVQAEDYQYVLNLSARALGQFYFSLDEAGNICSSVLPDYEKAYDYFSQAVCDTISNAYIGYLLLYGKGTEQSVEDGLEFLKNSIEVPIANYWLAQVYSAGELLPVDTQKARHYLQRAVETGCALKKLPRLFV